MSERTIFLIQIRPAPSQRAHFAIWVPYEEGGTTGTIIHVVGAPIVGFRLEFKRQYSHADTDTPKYIHPIGRVDVSNIDTTYGPSLAGVSADQTPHGNLEIAATRVRPPGISKNLLGPVDGVDNKRCQEWAMEYVKYLVEEQKSLGAGAINIVQSKRDPPEFGVGLKKAA